ncbi:MAG: hypothetical protein H6765_10810 [Candidatus Peribacteria bacterium]|nr:MAG: hypothetical protein H6765_10810 [Candidatus Peribacteria bacterium]
MQVVPSMVLGTIQGKPTAAIFQTSDLSKFDQKEYLRFYDINQVTQTPEELPENDWLAYGLAKTNAYIRRSVYEALTEDCHTFTRSIAGLRPSQ